MPGCSPDSYPPGRYINETNVDNGIESNEKGTKIMGAKFDTTSIKIEVASRRRYDIFRERFLEPY